MTTSTPQAVASCAASSLVDMPPWPVFPQDPPAMPVIRLSSFSTVDISFACESIFGSAVNSPSTCPNITNKSASTRLATIADRLSLSPNASPTSSSTATTSFSLMIGTTSSSKRDNKVFLMFK